MRQNLTLALLFTALITAHLYLQGMGESQIDETFESQQFKTIFQNWKQSLGRVYKSENEELFRLQVFRESYEKILEHEKLNESYTLGLTKFADMTDEEFKQNILMKTRDARHGPLIEAQEEDKLIRGTLNWANQGAVNAIQNQGNCGSCYTFAAAASTEAASFIQSPHGLKKFSEQQMVSCSQPYGNDGCDGGFGDFTFQYILEKGLTYESLYPYVSGKDSVVPDCEVQHGNFYISSYKNTVGRGHCTGIQEAVRLNPQYGRVAVDPRWKLYTSGIYKASHCGTDPEKIDHAITIVGYVTESNVPSERFWIIRNSWGTEWGEAGYMKLEYGNSCSICYESFSPIY